ncbi:MAG: hypothetical protein ACM3U2_14400 [Deltaproteobacteria bacterium]
MAILAVVVATIFWLYSRQPLYHTDLWGHLAYGRLIWETGSLPAREPFMPLARDVPLVDTAWLAQAGGFLVYSQWGPPAIQFLHALAIAVCCGILAQGVYRRTRSILWTIAGLGLFEALNWFQFQIVRPQMAGLVCCAALLAMITGRRWHNYYWAAIPAMLALWANLHGSFIVGLGYLACAAAGRTVDVWRRARSLAAPLRDSRVRRLFAVTALASLAVLLNPYGVRLYSEVIAFSRTPNLRALLEWQMLDLGSTQGKIAVGVAVALVLALTLSPRRVLAGELLALVVLGAAALWSARMLIWWTPVAAHALAIHAHEVWRRFLPAVSGESARRRSALWTSVAAGIVIAFIVATPLGTRIVTGTTPDLARSVSPQTPLGATAWLQEHPPAGQVFNVYEWGDYLVWAGPPHLGVFVTSQAHLVPPEVWRDYLAVIRVTSGWDEILNKYAVSTVVLDKQRRGALIAKLRINGAWSVVFEDEVAVILALR